MSTSPRGATAAGLTLMLLSASAGVHPGAGGLILLLCFAGILAGASLVAAGVRMSDDDPAPVVPAGALALAAFLRRGHLTVVGLVVASCAVTAVSGEAGPVLCSCSLAP